MKITSYQQLNQLIAQSLGWQESVHLESQIEPIPDVEIDFYHPPDVDKDNTESWFYEYGVAPDFHDNWCCIEEFIFPECDRLNLLIEYIRKPDKVCCMIRQINLTGLPDFPVEYKSSNGLGFTTKSMPLITCLTWLAFKKIKFELDLEKCSPH